MAATTETLKGANEMTTMTVAIDSHTVCDITFDETNFQDSEGLPPFVHLEDECVLGLLACGHFSHKKSEWLSVWDFPMDGTYCPTCKQDAPFHMAAAKHVMEDRGVSFTYETEVKQLLVDFKNASKEERPAIHEMLMEAETTLV